MDSIYGAWMQPAGPQDSLHHPSGPTEQSWKDPASTTATSTNGPGPSSGSQPTLDLNDFGLSVDINGGINPHGTSGGTSTSSPASGSQQYGHFSQYPFFLPGPFNVTPYGSNPQWPPSVPLSSYSSLNGATTNTNGQMSSPPQMVIDPALTMGTPPTASNSQPYSLSTRSPFSSYHNSTMAINPAFVHSFPPSHQIAQSPPQTLAPYALHAPSPPVETISPTAFYQQSTPSTSTSATPPSNTPISTSNKLSPQARQERFNSTIKPLLQPNQFTGAGAVSDLADKIIALDVPEVDGPLRLEILTKIRDNAGNHYFRAWVENEDAMDITREWLKAAAKGDDQLAETIMPLLHIIDRLPWSLESLRKAKLGKIILKLTKEASIPAVKDMASNLERKWRQMASTNPKDDPSKKSGDTETSEDTKTKKRKPSEPPPKPGPPAKKTAVTLTTTKSTTTATKTSAVKDAKSDSSFFSAPKPKPKLPSFKKAPVPMKKEPEANVAQPSSLDPFQEALKSMAKGRKESPSVTPIPQQPTPPTLNTTATVTAGLTKTLKKKKSVSWAPDGRLEQVKLIERAVYDDDPVDGTTIHNIRDLDRDEGAAMHAQLFEELIDWAEPQVLDIPQDIELRSRGEASQERLAQEEREKTALGAFYISVTQIPDSPAEPPVITPDDEVDSTVRHMVIGPDAESIFLSAPPPSEASAGAFHNDQFGGPSVMSIDEDPNKPFPPMDPSMLSTMSAGLGNMTPEHLTQLLATLASQNGMYGQQQQQQGVHGQQVPPYGSVGNGTGQEDWNAAHQQWGDYGGYQQEDTGDVQQQQPSQRGGWDRGGFRGRGRGRGRGGGLVGDGYKDGRKRKPCTFFAQGRCRYGDQCDFSHEAY
ncbi:hypothetical protein BJ322DRAFT_1075692 [Thelephora terrestris]|uniref:Serine/threonine-protein phosphatase 1 regulatory subunit 10 n=1 Tax=Thelephora terrestris TaxID=56493 RepID=A0A9P6H9C3_9AGAM|nr:hypothetical protein BJ322DRAFT_1075692 [Thelephora terrestris]